MWLNNQHDPMEYIFQKVAADGNPDLAMSMRMNQLHKEMQQKQELQKMEDRLFDRVYKKVRAEIGVSIQNDTKKAIDDLKKSLDGLSRFSK